MNAFSSFLLFTLWFFSSIAQAVEIGDKDWRQLTDTMGVTYNELTSIYDVSTGHLLDESRYMIRNVNFSGWTWATAQDVYAMYSLVVGKTLESYDYYYEENPSWLYPFFNNLFEYTERTDFDTVAASGIGRDGAHEYSVIAMKVWIGIDDDTSKTYFGGVETRGVPRDSGGVEDEIHYGIYMYRTKREKQIDRPVAFLKQVAMPLETGEKYILPIL